MTVIQYWKKLSFFFPKIVYNLFCCVLYQVQQKLIQLKCNTHAVMKTWFETVEQGWPTGRSRFHYFVFLEFISRTKKTYLFIKVLFYLCLTYTNIKINYNNIRFTNRFDYKWRPFLLGKSITIATTQKNSEVDHNSIKISYPCNRV